MFGTKQTSSHLTTVLPSYAGDVALRQQLSVYFKTTITTTPQSLKGTNTSRTLRRVYVVPATSSATVQGSLFAN